MNIELFNFQNHEVRVIVTEDGEPEWVATDVAKILGYNHTPHMLRRLDDDEKGVRKVDTLGGAQELTTINEPGLYTCILGSRKPEAREFKRWVTHEVLPSIRKRGGYINPNATEHQKKALMYELRAQMELAQAAKGLIHEDYLEAKARIILAQGMGEVPVLDPATRPLYVQNFLKEKGLSKKQLSAKASGFGKRLKNQWVKQHGREPQKAPIELTNGRIIEVYGYTEADRPLMERIWEAHYAA